LIVRHLLSRPSVSDEGRFEIPAQTTVRQARA
jgi:hypothetical protein